MNAKAIRRMTSRQLDFKQTHRFPLRLHNARGESWTQSFAVKTNRKTSLKELWRFIRDEEAYVRRCHCAHDCCGHINGGPFQVMRLSPTRFIIRGFYGYNV